MSVPVAVPRRAASVILLRDDLSGGDYEVFMLRRPDDARFAPGAYSFPGGVLDAEDHAAAQRMVRELPGGMTVADLHERLRGDGPFASPDAETSAALH